MLQRVMPSLFYGNHRLVFVCMEVGDREKYRLKPVLLCKIKMVHKILLK